MATYGGLKRTENIINDYTGNWILFWSLDATGSIYSISRPSIMLKDTPGCQGYTYSQLTTYRQGNWDYVMLTSVLYPKIRWIFSRVNNPSNLSLFLQVLLNGGNPGSYMTINAQYSVTLDLEKSSVPNSGSNPYILMHNNNGSEAGDIPTFGVSGGYVWGTGMFWGNIDAFTNYGGLLNQTTAHVGSSLGSTGDRLLVYVK